MREEKTYDFVVVGGGMSGICAAIAAARYGIQVALIHNRPVLGGMASSEHRMHICGADRHMSNPNARETGILEEILLEHKRRNPENSYAIFDSVVWEKVKFQEHLDLYLNTHMTGVEVDQNHIIGITAVQLTTEKEFHFFGKMFLDATGDGTLGAKAGAEYRLGREARGIYGESLAPEQGDSVTMGSSLMFQTKDVGHPVPFVKPFWAYTFDESQLRLRDHSDVTSGYWWIELGGVKERIIEDGEQIRDELLKTIFGVWDHIKNGGDHGAENLELEWGGFLPGKRESRRLIGDYVLKQQDCAGNTAFPDAVAYGGWTMDIHTPGGFADESSEATVWNQVKDIYRIPYRCLYSKNIENLFLGGRAISCSRVAFSSTRVMATCAVTGQAAGTAAALAVKKGCTPREVGKNITELQQELLKNDCYIPGIRNCDLEDQARTAVVSATSELPGYEAAQVINGISRTEGNVPNCWKANMSENPKLILQWKDVIQASEIQLTFDSNLSREITPSINRAVLQRQSRLSPPELIRDYEVCFWHSGELVYQTRRAGDGQRLQRINLSQSVVCDTITLEPLNTYGCDTAAVYEVRVYASR